MFHRTNSSKSLFIVLFCWHSPDVAEGYWPDSAAGVQGLGSWIQLHPGSDHPPSALKYTVAPSQLHPPTVCHYNNKEVWQTYIMWVSRVFVSVLFGAIKSPLDWDLPLYILFDPVRLYHWQDVNTLSGKLRVQTRLLTSSYWAKCQKIMLTLVYLHLCNNTQS